jgi:hypothetical protein
LHTLRADIEETFAFALDLPLAGCGGASTRR